jgi:hypothetical protein
MSNLGYVIQTGIFDCRIQTGNHYRDRHENSLTGITITGAITLAHCYASAVQIGVLRNSSPENDYSPYS